MRRVVIAALAAVGLLAALSGTASAEPLSNASFAEDVDVTIVYVGIENGEIDTAAVEAGLPATSTPKIRYRLFYGDTAGADLGITYRLRYRHVFADPAFEQALGTFLNANAQTTLAQYPQASTPTVFQQDYNAQKNALRNITTNKWIDGPATEAKLGDLAAAAGIDVTKPTIFFVDASDVGYHTYVKTDVTDPDTGYNFGVVRGSRKTTAWGGTPNDTAATTSDRRVWFYDLSAGPEGWTNNWNVDDADVDGDNAADYRLPPIWHYTPGPGGALRASHPGFPTSTLSADLGRVTRYVGLNLLFASSPLYPPFFQPNRIPSNVILDVNTVEWWNNVDVSARFIKPSFIQTAVDGLPAGPTVTVGPEPGSPVLGRLGAVLPGLLVGQEALLQRPRLGRVRALREPVPRRGAQPERVPALVDAGRHVPGRPDQLGRRRQAEDPQGLLGFADDNWLNGTQSGVFSFVYPEVVPLGYGLTTTMTHEYGHHSSMSHPHDGYDSASDVDYGPSGDTNYAWLGDMSDSIMSYMDLADGFSQFDQDNSARHHAAGYAKIANVLATPLGPLQKVSDANAKLGQARTAWAAQDYSAALAYAKAAYADVVSAYGGLDKVPVLTPGTWAIAGPVKPGNGMKNAKSAAYARDLDERFNVKRLTTK